MTLKVIAEVSVWPIKRLKVMDETTAQVLKRPLNVQFSAFQKHGHIFRRHLYINKKAGL